MAFSSGTSSGSSQQLPNNNNSCSEEDLQALMHLQRKQRRMLSNRESARRSRLRKQKHLDDLVAQVGRLRRENSQILAALHPTTRLYLSMEADNSVLRTQIMELNARLQSLSDILYMLHGYGGAR